jgi:hypothetical protein
LSFKSGLERCLGAAFIIVLLGLLGARPARADESTLSLDEYWRQLEETQASIASLQEASSEASQDQLLVWADRWERVTGVVLADGTRVPLDHSLLLSRLQADPPDLVSLEKLLSTLLATRPAWPASGRTAADIAALDSILAQPEFQWQSPRSPLAEWWQNLWERVDQFLSRLLPQGDGRAGGQLLQLLSHVLTFVGTLALALVLAYVLRDLLADFAADVEMSPDVEAGDEDLTAATALKRAEIVSGEGDYRSAVRYLYLSTLLLLEERGLLRYDRSLTNREYLRSVGHLPQLAGLLRDVIEVFDRVWYGYRPLDAADYARYAARVAELQRLP